MKTRFFGFPPFYYCLLLIFVFYLLTIEIKVEKWRRIQKWVKIRGALSTKKNEWINVRKHIFLQKPLDTTPKRNLVWKRWIPPRREIWSGSNGSHPEEKSDQGATDPTPKRNLVKEPGIPPRRKFMVGKQNGEKKVKLTSTKKKLTLAFKVMTSK